MARDDNYTKTGKGWLAGVGRFMSYIPFVGLASFVPIMIDSIVESAQWLFRGKFLSAATSLVAGTVDAGVSSASGSLGLGFLQEGAKDLYAPCQIQGSHEFSLCGDRRQSRRPLHFHLQQETKRGS